MRVALFIFLPLLFACATAARAQSPSPANLPDAGQLLQVPVGGTHIPRDRQPRQVVNPYEGNSDAIAQGRVLFHSMNCVGCHAAQGGGSMGPPLSDKVWIYGKEPGQIYLTITQGRPNGMPAFGNALTPDSIWKLVTYVRTLSKPDSAPVTQSTPGKQTGSP
jgi:cytochrome c oxidase cbb3-type subunit III